MTNPKCPITGEPAIRNVQWLDAEDLITGWKYIFGAPAGASFGDTKHIGLWESPTGLYFFDPITKSKASSIKRCKTTLSTTPGLTMPCAPSRLSSMSRHQPSSSQICCVQHARADW